jgi:hypothetical protein
MANYKISTDTDNSTFTGTVTGTIVAGGSESHPDFSVRDNADLTAARVSHGSITPGSGELTGIRPATTSTGAVFNVVQEGHWVGPYITDGTLAGVTKTTHNTPASDYGRRGIHRQVTARGIGISNWNYLTGAPTYTHVRGSGYTMHRSTGAGTVDNASNPTLGVPGDLVYRNGAPSGIFADYPEKNQVK